MLHREADELEMSMCDPEASCRPTGHVHIVNE
jgi:hypothetical protein